jgi:hypothetical protein
LHCDTAWRIVWWPPWRRRRGSPEALQSLPSKCDSLPSKCDSLPSKCDSLPSKCDSLPSKCHSLSSKCHSLPYKCHSSPSKWSPWRRRRGSLASRRPCSPACAGTGQVSQPPRSVGLARNVVGWLGWLKILCWLVGRCVGSAWSDASGALGWLADALGGPGRRTVGWFIGSTMWLGWAGAADHDAPGGPGSPQFTL